MSVTSVSLSIRSFPYVADLFLTLATGSLRLWHYDRGDVSPVQSSN